MDYTNIREILFSKLNILISIIIFTSLLITFSPCNAYGESLSELADKKEQAIREYEDAVVSQEEIQSRIDSLQYEIDLIQNDLAEKENRLGKMVRESYISNTSAFSVFLYSVLSNSSLTDVFINLDYYDKIVEEQNKIVIEVKESKSILDNKQHELMISKEEIDRLVTEAEEAKETAIEAYEKLKEEIQSQLVGGTYSGEFPEGWMTVSQMKFTGAVDAYGFHYTYYSELVLPGGGLNIPGRHTESCGCVCDGDGYIVVASDTLGRGSLVPTPLICHPIGKIYDCGVGRADGLDLYLH